jgi:hypothetical protein
MKILDYHDWISQYKPEYTEDDARPVDIGYRDPRIETHPLHIWTYLAVPCECDGPDEDNFPTTESYDAAWDAWNEDHFDDCPLRKEPDIFNGAYLVNRLEYHYCEIPFKEDDDIGVL